MISERLLSSILCVTPDCREKGAPRLRRIEEGVRCPRCGRVYEIKDGYLDLMPPDEGAHESLYVSHEGEFEATLDYKRIGPPVLGAGVRQRAISRMLGPGKSDRLIELGCGNGKFVYWNRNKVEWAVGIDPAPLFAKDALKRIDLCQADARALPFADGTFTTALSIDVLEHLPIEDLRLYLREAHRVLERGGRIFIFSNTREGSRLDFIVRTTRRLSRWLGERGLLDDSRDRLRKSDHVKAVETYPQLVSLLKECGWRVDHVMFWNGLFQSLIENLLVKLGESAIRRLRGRKSGGTATASRSGEDALRSSIRNTLTKRGWAYKGMKLLTELMWVDLALFGGWRAGPYFLVAMRQEDKR
jgi:SAM-dependent methyltransferase